MSAATADDPNLHVPCGAVVNAAGPYAHHVNQLLGGGASLPPLENEIHAKAMLSDVEGAVPSDAPMMIYEDNVTLPWSEEEAEVEVSAVKLEVMAVMVVLVFLTFLSLNLTQHLTR